VTERNAFLVICGELNVGHYNALLPVEEKDMLGISDVSYYKKSLPEIHLFRIDSTTT
jgi:hypothetical protein